MKERILSVAMARTGKGFSLSLILTRWLVSALALLLLLLLLLFSNSAHAQTFAPGSLPLVARSVASLSPGNQVQEFFTMFATNLRNMEKSTFRSMKGAHHV